MMRPTRREREEFERHVPGVILRALGSGVGAGVLDLMAGRQFGPVVMGAVVFVMAAVLYGTISILSVRIISLARYIAGPEDGQDWFDLRRAAEDATQEIRDRHRGIM